MTRTYVVTGAAAGVGKAAAEYLRGKGGKVIGVDRSSGVEIQCDLSTDEGRASMIAQVTARVGDSLDGVLACAGGATNTEYDVKVNYFGAVATLDGLRPLLANGNAPRAVAVCSINSFWAPSKDIVEACLGGEEAAAVRTAEQVVRALPPGVARSVAYTSAKRALALWLRRVAPTPEWAGAGIGINAIGPGVILTAPMLEMFKDPEILEAANKFLPMPYGGHSTPEQLAPTLAFLASEECAVMTGQLIYVDGGVDVCFRGEDIYSWNDANAARILAG